MWEAGLGVVFLLAASFHILALELLLVLLGRYGDRICLDLSNYFIKQSYDHPLGYLLWCNLWFTLLEIIFILHDTFISGMLFKHPSYNDPRLTRCWSHTLHAGRVNKCNKWVYSQGCPWSWKSFGNYKVTWSSCCLPETWWCICGQDYWAWRLKCIHPTTVLVLVLALFIYSVFPPFLKVADDSATSWGYLFLILTADLYIPLYRKWKLICKLLLVSNIKSKGICPSCQFFWSNIYTGTQLENVFIG